MSKPSVKVKEKEYSVSNISVVLKINSGPLIRLRLSEKLDGTESKISNEETFNQEFFQDICDEVEASFQWGGASLKFILVGYNSSEARKFELVGLVVKKDLIDWFNQNNFKDKKQDYLIYQKNKGKNSWPFLNKVLGDKFKPPSQDFVEKIKLLFPDNGCIWRYKDSNNFHFLNRVIAFASRHLPELQGWCAFDDADKPLRLILFEEKKQDQTIPKLDQTWTPSSHPFLPNRYSWNRWLDKSSTLTRELSIKNGKKADLIKELVSHGSNNKDGHNFQAQNPTRLLFSPGTITIGKRNIFCHTVSYEFDLPVFGEEESPSVMMKIEVDYPERQIGDNEIISLRLSGKFQEWHQKKDGVTEVKIAPSELKNWGIIDEKDQSLKPGDDGVLYAQILSPTYSDKKYSGIYIKHEKDDEMIVDIHPCGIPLVLGSVQKYRQELEQADVTLSGEKLAISVSEHHQSLDKSEAIVLDSSEIKLNHGKKIFGQAQKNIDFLSQNLEIGSSQVNISSGKTKINSSVNISFPSPKMADAAVNETVNMANLAEAVGDAAKAAAEASAVAITAGATKEATKAAEAASNAANSAADVGKLLAATDGSVSPSVLAKASNAAKNAAATADEAAKAVEKTARGTEEATKAAKAAEVASNAVNNATAAAEQAAKAGAQKYEHLDQGHSLDRHGPEVSDAKLIKRLTSGVAPDGKVSPTKASTRFNSYEDWLATRESAMNDIAKREGIDLKKPPPHGKEGPFRITKDHQRPIDDGFVGDGNSNKIKVTDPSSSKTKKISVFSKTKQVNKLTRTTTTIEWNKGSNRWEVKQHFPYAQNWDQKQQTYTK